MPRKMLTRSSRLPSSGKSEKSGLGTRENILRNLSHGKSNDIGSRTCVADPLDKGCRCLRSDLHDDQPWAGVFHLGNGGGHRSTSQANVELVKLLQ